METRSSKADDRYEGLGARRPSRLSPAAFPGQFANSNTDPAARGYDSFASTANPRVSEYVSGPGTAAVGLRVLLAAGGTGGHIFPALAVAEELRTRASRRGPWDSGCAIQFLGTPRGLESKLIQGSGFPFTAISAAGLKGMGGWKTLRNLLVLPQSMIETGAVFRDFRPGVVVGIGGYVSGPAMLRAALAGIPTLLIEPNALPGFTNRVLRPFVRLAAVGFKETAAFYGSKARFTGHPVRKAMFEVPAKVHAAPYTILVVGGSQGSSAINQCVLESLPYFRPAVLPVQLIHQTGQREYEKVQRAYQQHGVAGEVYAFIDDMAAAFARADVVVSRSGAITVAELAAAGKAALLVPFPGAADQHQRENARVLEQAGGARVIEQAELTPVRLAREVVDLLNAPERLALMERGARSLARPGAAERIADLVEELAAGAGRRQN